MTENAPRSRPYGRLLVNWAERLMKHRFLSDEASPLDGAIDNSFGCRANKWTYWGSRTSDGSLFDRGVHFHPVGGLITRHLMMPVPDRESKRLTITIREPKNI